MEGKGGERVGDRWRERERKGWEIDGGKGRGKGGRYVERGEGGKEQR